MSCQVCGLTTNLKSCGSCLQVNYCSREHQIAHWKDHKPWCRGSKSSKSGIATTASPVKGNGKGPTDIVIGAGNADPVIVDHNSQGPSSSQIASLPANNQPTLPISQVEGTSSFQAQQSILPNRNLALETTVPMQANPLNSGSVCDNNSQICSPMASLQVCDSSSSLYFGGPQPMPAAADKSSFISQHVMSTDLSNRDAVFNNLNTYCQIILQDMNQYGFCVIDNFLQNGEQILYEVKDLYDRGLFRAGQVVNNRTTTTNTKMIRGDQIVWVEGNESLCNNIGFLIRILDSIITKCNTTFAAGEFLKYTINRRTKAMIACYPGNNAKYVRHIDNPNSDGRCITSIYYLNKDYNQQRDGGVLRLFPQMNDGIVANIEPKFNRVIFFFSDKRNPHQVTESSRLRFAITVWYFDDNERAKAIEKYKEQSLACPNDTDMVPF